MLRAQASSWGKLHVWVAALAGAVGPSFGAIYGVKWAMSPSRIELAAEGKDLFSHEWTQNDPLCGGGDGLGPVFNRNSCAACHFQGGTGGAGGPQHNVNAFTVLPNRFNPDVLMGVVHTDAVSDGLRETVALVRQQHPVVPKSSRVVNGCTRTIEDFDPVHMESINTPALFGAGLIDSISSSAINANYRQRALHWVGREFQLDFEGTGIGHPSSVGVGRVGKFGWKGQFGTLKEFVASACAMELGLTNRHNAQMVPQKFRADDKAALDMTERQLDALVEFCRQLPRPEQVLPSPPKQREAAIRGEQHFHAIGCAECHTPDIGGVAGIYSDFLLHDIDQTEGGDYRRIEPEVPIPSSMTPLAEWKTPPLWGVADSAPYLHDGSAPTLEGAILAHDGEARFATKRFKDLGSAKQRELVLFLKTLRAPLPAPVNVASK